MRSGPRNRGQADGLVVLAIVALAVGGLLAWLVPKYGVYVQTLRGKAALREAEWSRQILVEEARAQQESEVMRANGVAEANRIIGESLDGNEDYLRYLWIQHLSDQSSKVIYVPTEANLPILEAGLRP